MSVYQDAIDCLKGYVRDRHLGFQFKKSERTSSNYNPIFHQDWYKATLSVFKLIEFGGIHPITFNFMDPYLFDRDQTTGLFQPHHMDSREKHQLQFSAFLIFDEYWHGRFGPLSRTELGVQLQNELRDKILELMQIDRDVTVRDIERVFGDFEMFGMKVSDMWKSLGEETFSVTDFNKQLKRWNEARKLIREGRIEEFLDEFFKLRDENGVPIVGKYGEMNPVLKMYKQYAKNVFEAYLLLKDSFDFSYLFSEKDKEVFKRYFEI